MFSLHQLVEPETNSTFEILITEMEQAINRMKHISAQYHPIPISLENSALRKRLYNQFEQERTGSLWPTDKTNPFA